MYNYEFFVISTVPPTITRVSPVGVNLNALENNTFSVIVNVSANPEPEYVWSKDSNPVTNPNILTTLTSITFNPILREDAGFYLLTVMNSAGRDTHNFTLDVMCKWIIVTCICACILYLCTCVRVLALSSSV